MSTITTTELELPQSTKPDVVPTTLHYFSPPSDGSRPWSRADLDPVTGKAERNWETDLRTVFVENIRGHESDYSLDVNGFEYHTGSTQLRAEDFFDDDTIQQVYYPESIGYIKKLTGAKKVVLFDHTVRRHIPGQIDSDSTKRQPVQGVHGDQTDKSARVRVKRHLPEAEAEEILQSGTRFQIINLWRPIGNPAIDFPLGFCDFRSINVAHDLFPHHIIFKTYEGETLNVRYNEGHKWKYLRGQTPDEFALIKCYDSKYPDVSLMTAHTAFIDPTTPSDAPKRQSIELRALVFY